MIKFLSNIYNPELPDAKNKIKLVDGFGTPQEQWQAHLDWLKGKIIQAPVGTDFYTSEQLKAQGMVSVWQEEEF